MKKSRDNLRKKRKTVVTCPHDDYDVEEESQKIVTESDAKDKKRGRQRQENSLGELTKNFINYIKEKGDNVVHINDVVKKLKVKKRRIYDITNVLEGMF